jgi:hypothetical protein
LCMLFSLLLKAYCPSVFTHHSLKFQVPHPPKVLPDSRQHEASCLSSHHISYVSPPWRLPCCLVITISLPYWLPMVAVLVT